jgi:hypothetical protein
VAENFGLRRWLIGTALLSATLGSLHVRAELLSQEEQLERLSILGPDFIVEPIPAPVIEDVSVWVNRVPGSYVYRVVSDAAEGEALQTEQHIPLDRSELESWQRVVEDRLVETFVAEEGRDVLIVEEVDQQHGFRLVMEPGVHIPRTISPGHEWEIDSKITAYRIEDGSQVRDGMLKAVHSYEGAYRVRCPAGEFDAVLVREDFQIHVGPLKAEDDRLLLFAKGVGLVAEIEGIKASALFVFHLHEDTAKMLEQYPDTLPAVGTSAE